MVDIRDETHLSKELVLKTPDLEGTDKCHDGLEETMPVDTRRGATPIGWIEKTTLRSRVTNPQTH